MIGPLSHLSPVPAPWALPHGYPRYDPGPHDLRHAIDHLAGRLDWPELSWAALVEALLRVGSADIPLARLVEGHVDALRILDQAGAEPRAGACYGVWASRSAGTGVAATPAGDGLRLNGTIRFASGAGVLDRALVPVWLDADTHLLVDLDVERLPVDTRHWQTPAMRVSRTHTVAVEDVTVPRSAIVGEPGFYLDRPGFWPGGVGVAAIWTGGLVRVLDLGVALLTRRRVTAGQDRRLGAARLHLVGAITAVRTAGCRLDELRPRALGSGELRRVGGTGGLPSHPAGTTVAELCAEARALVAGAAVEAIAEVRTLVGPAGLAFDLDLGRALDDLGLYVAQLDADAEATRLGTALRGTRGG